MPPDAVADAGPAAVADPVADADPDPVADPVAWTVADAAGHVRPPRHDDDKYARGVLGFRTGSERYPGAAVLGVEAAWRTGLGMVRYLGGERPTALVLQRRPETVTADGRVQAWIVGSGTDAAERSPAETEALRGILSGDAPVVVDAGALDLAAAATAPVVVTPHASELATLRASMGLSREGGDRAAAALETARALGGAVLSKAATTIVATPGGWVRRIDAPTNWLATAGTGDVLAGVLGALVAGAPAPVDVEALGALAATAVWLHGRAAVLASAARGDGPITALDVAEALPHAVGEALAAR